MRVFAIALILIGVGAAVWYSMNRDRLPIELEVSEEVEVEEEPSIIPPTFDLVRVTRDGFATVAGRGEPGGVAQLFANGELLSQEPIGSDGTFAMAVDTPLESGTVEMTLRQIADGMTIIGEESVIMYIPEGDDQGPVVLRTTPGGTTTVLQRSSPIDPSLGPLSIDTIDYDREGNVILAGRAEPDMVVQIFANGRPVEQTQVDQRGTWQVTGRLAPGRYTLQIVQLDEEGRPKYAIEVPFEQARQEDIVFSNGNVIVQPGNNLWVIARRAYGSGFQYTVIYEANQGQIRDPDLIYPGQIFRVPDSEEADGGN
ncbi:MAG: LysM peptidoglycan-binding domain-containing protein [Pseudomonadota bacterium]